MNMLFRMNKINGVDVRHLRYFLAVSEAGSYTAAGQQLHLTQSALSVSIRNLERELGSPLFQRSSNGVRLTPAGEALAPAARDIVHRLDAVVDEARAAQGKIAGTLSVGIMHSLALIDGASLLRRFHLEHPQVTVRPLPTLHGAASVLEGVRRGDLDIGFAWSTAMAGDDVVIEPLATDHFVLVTEAADDSQGASATTHSAANLPFIDLPSGWASRTAIDEAFSKAKVSRFVAVEVADLTLCVELVRAGLGATILPSSYVSDERGLRIRPFADIAEWTMSLVLPKLRTPTAAARELANLARADRDSRSATRRR
jgi:DNA-binding transcriptional LysR family regulator